MSDHEESITEASFLHRNVPNDEDKEQLLSTRPISKDGVGCSDSIVFKKFFKQLDDHQINFIFILID